MFGKNETNRLLELIRNNEPMTVRQQIGLTVRLSLPAMMAQISSIVMQYIDASMVGHLGANESAAIGLVSTSTWMFWGLCTAAATGFSVQVAHRLGAGEKRAARDIVRQSITATLLFSLVLTVIGVAISPSLPLWLGGTSAIAGMAHSYFLIFMLSLPALQLNFLAGSMLRCSGNMTVPSLLNVIMCVLDVLFNFVLIFPTREIVLGGMAITVYGADLGVTGAALGTALAEIVVGVFMMWYLCARSPELKFRAEEGGFMPTHESIQRALHIGLPMGCEHFVMCGAQIISTVIVAPLGAFAIAANSFAITAESLCYMPGYGIADAATTLVGQSVGAQRKDLIRRFANTAVLCGIAVMTFMGAVMYLCAPVMMRIMTPNPEILSLGVMALRIESFAEPMFAASIVAYGVFVGAGNTVIPALMNFGSMWGVRLTLAALLAPVMGLKGVWIAMCVELCFRGVIFLVRLVKGDWIKLNQ